MLSAFQLSWATDNTDATDLHRFRFPFSRSYTLPPSGSPPGSKGESEDRYTPFSTLSTPSHSGANEVFRRWTKCPSVPCEGSNPHCDARTGRGGVRFHLSVYHTPPLSLTPDGGALYLYGSCARILCRLLRPGFPRPRKVRF